MEDIFAETKKSQALPITLSFCTPLSLPHPLISSSDSAVMAAAAAVVGVWVVLIAAVVCFAGIVVLRCTGRERDNDVRDGKTSLATSKTCTRYIPGTPL